MALCHTLFFIGDTIKVLKGAHLKKIILTLAFILWGTVALGAVSLDVDVSGGLDFGYMVIPDSGTNTLVVPATGSSVVVSFISSEPGDTVSVELSGPNVSENRLLLDSGNVSVDFSNSTGGWTGIPTDTPFYIGGVMGVTSSATGNNLLNENITVTVTSESIN